MPIYIPQELQTKVLLRLPVKSLLRFCCVCKRWADSISSQEFATDHLATWKPPEDEGLVTIVSFKLFLNVGMYSFYLRSNITAAGLEYGQQLADPFASELAGDGFHSIIAHCNGVIGLRPTARASSRLGCDVLLWNPSIRKSVAIQGPVRRPDAGDRGPDIAWGLGYDSGSDDYKLVRIVDSEPCSTMVYSLRDGNWTTIATTLHCDEFRSISESSVFVNGSCHWLAKSRDENFQKVSEILVFDVTEKEFRTIAAPDADLGRRQFLLLIDGRLSLVARMPDRRFSLWMMEEYGVAESWARLIDDGALITTACVDGFRLRAEPELAEYRKLHHGPPADMCSSYLDLSNYRESLLLLRQGRSRESRLDG